MTPEEWYEEINNPKTPDPTKDAVTFTAELECGHRTVVTWPTIRYTRCVLCAVPDGYCKQVRDVQPIYRHSMLILKRFDKFI